MLITMEISISGNPTFVYCMKVIGYPFFALTPARTTLALAPMRVPFPPRQAPRERAHHSGATSTPLLSIVSISGMRVATNGMLSKKDEMMADTHRMMMIPRA